MAGMPKPSFEYSNTAGPMGLQANIARATGGYAPGTNMQMTQPAQQAPQGNRVTGSEIRPMSQGQFNALNNAGQKRDLYAPQQQVGPTYEQKVAQRNAAIDARDKASLANVQSSMSPWQKFGYEAAKKFSQPAQAAPQQAPQQAPQPQAAPQKPWYNPF